MITSAAADSDLHTDSSIATERDGGPEVPSGSAPPEDPESNGSASMEGRASRGAVWVVLGYGGSQVIRLIGNLILTRLLFAEAFGVMALMSTVLQGLELFSDIGIGPSIIQNPRNDRPFVNTAWTMQVLRGVAIWAFACALAVPCAALYEEPRLVWLLPLVSSTALISGLNSTRVFTLNRNLDVGRIEISLIASQVAGLVTMVTWALIDASVLALVAGALTTSLARTVMTHTYLPGEKNALAWDRDAARELIRFGRWIFVSTLLTFLAGQSDRLVFGKMVSLELLGVYYMGVVIAMIPSEALSRLSMQIIFPVYSRVWEESQDLERVFDRIRTPVVVLAGWAFAGLIAGGPTAVDLLYDPRYQEAGWVVQMLAFGGFLHVLGATYGAALLAAGLPQWVSAGSFAKIVGMAILIPTGAALGSSYLGDHASFPGAVMGYAASELLRYVVTAAACRSLGLTGFGRDLRLIGLLVSTGALGAALEYTMRQAEMHVVLRSAIIAVAVTVAWIPVGGPIVRARLARRRAAKQANAALNDEGL